MHYKLGRIGFTVVGLVALATVGTSAQSFDDTCRVAMAPYYAALAASAQHDTEGTLRHLVEFQARWKKVAGLDAPAWALDASTGQTALQGVASRVQAARNRLNARDAAGAHVELEAIRVLLRDARSRHNVSTIDDAFTGFHDAMERITGRVGQKNEVTLRPEDFGPIRDETSLAQAAWVALTAESPDAGADWRRVGAGVSATLATLSRGATEHNGDRVQSAATELRREYFELLAVLAKGS